MKINHNIAALNAYRNLSTNNTNVAKSLEKLSSGLRINRAADDAAGLAISEKMRSQIRGLNMAERNTLDAISFIQIAEGGLSSTHEILQRMRELAVQAANDTNTTTDREALQKEINELTKEIERISQTTEYNTKKLLNGNLQASGTGALPGGTGPATMQIGANQGQTVQIELNNMGVVALGLATTTPAVNGSVVGIPGIEDTDYYFATGPENIIGSGATDMAFNTDGGSYSFYAISVTDHVNASSAITAFEAAIHKVSAERSRLGAIQNRLEHTSNNLRYMAENMTASESRIRDLDMALEMSEFTKNNILVQSAQAMLAQANQLPQGVLQLLQ